MTLLTLPKACLMESSASSKSIKHFSICCNSSSSYNSVDKTEPLDPRSSMA
jgi:hypothetical protein